MIEWPIIVAGLVIRKLGRYNNYKCTKDPLLGP